MTIEERAKECANEWRHDNAYGLVEDYIQKALTEQDRISRAEERKKCIDEVCEFMYNFHLPNGVAPLYDYVGNVRKAIEKGGNNGTES